jgi:2-isopropylmalate synthase
MKSPVTILDTTLRDGTQAEGVTFSLEDKVGIARKLDDLGIHYVEGGYPYSNPKDASFFREVRKRPLRQAHLVAFGMTRRKGLTVEKDPGLRALLEAETPAISVVGKSWDLHVREVLRVEPEENLAMVRETVAFLKAAGREVIFDAEHFFDGYGENPDYALASLQAAQDAGADLLVLCDTNGGSLPDTVADVTRAVAAKVAKPLGIHAHNDGGLAVANSLAAVAAGAVHVQGTTNGFGERCGNADLCVVIPNLMLKMGRTVLPEDRLRRLTEVARYVYEVANLPPAEHQPFVGLSAFTHKGGMHVDAVRKNERTYEHVAPTLVGNERRLLISELSGGATILAKTEKYNLSRNKELLRQVLQQVQEREAAGYQFEAAEASFELLVKQLLGHYRPHFELLSYRVTVDEDESRPPAGGRAAGGHPADRGATAVEATVKLRVGEETVHTASAGDGPVNALDGALRKALAPFFPRLAEMKLVDYKVRVVNPTAGTAARVRVIIKSRDHTDLWSTVGASENIIAASWQALADSVEYKLVKDEEQTSPTTTA